MRTPFAVRKVSEGTFIDFRCCWKLGVWHFPWHPDTCLHQDTLFSPPHLHWLLPTLVFHQARIVLRKGCVPRCTCSPILPTENRIRSILNVEAVCAVDQIDSGSLLRCNDVDVRFTAASGSLTSVPRPWKAGFRLMAASLSATQILQLPSRW